MSPTGHPLPRAIALAHQLVQERLPEGGMAVDATSGNGYDTLFLAECVGEAGEVLAIDLQEEAIEATRLKTANHSQVHYHCGDHRDLGSLVTDPVHVLMFNLGYLPSGDKNIITKTDTTLAALEAGLTRLLPGGICTVVAYPGHAGGDAERDAVVEWCSRLDQDSWAVAHYRFLNQVNAPPELIAIFRRNPG